MAAELGRPRVIGDEVDTPRGRAVLLDIMGPIALVEIDGRPVTFDEDQVHATRGWTDRRGEARTDDRRR